MRDLAELIGNDALTETDRRYLSFEDALEQTLMNQGKDESRSLEQTLDLAWQVASELPRQELTMVSAATLAQRYHEVVPPEAS
jgi:V/A-type H+-transporting ATPase subunit B